MLCVAEFTIPPEAFPFGSTLAEMPDVEIEVDQIVPTDESALPYFWVRGCDPDEFMERAEREPEVSGARQLDGVGDTALFRAEWRPDAAVIEGLRDLDVTIVEAVGTAEHWRFEVRTPDRDVFKRFQAVFEEQGVPVDLVRLYDLDELLEGDRRQLTDEQRDALLAAYQEGYFDKPRETTQAELGERFGISRRAVSERLRRGTRNLIESALLPEEAS